MTTPTDEGMSAPAQFLTDPTPATIEQLQFRAINRLRSLLLAGGAVAAPDEVRACVADAINLVQAAIFDARALAARAAVEATPDAEFLRLLALCETSYYTATRALDVPTVDLEQCRAHHARARSDLIAHVRGVLASDAWRRLAQLASEEYADAAASVQHGADGLPEVPEWARLVAALTPGALSSDLPRLCRYGTPSPTFQTQPCDCPPGSCRLGREPQGFPGAPVLRSCPATRPECPHGCTRHDCDSLVAETAAAFGVMASDPAATLRRLRDAARAAQPQLCDTSTRGLREADELRAALAEADAALGVTPTPEPSAAYVTTCGTPDHCRFIQRCARVPHAQAQRCDTVPPGVPEVDLTVPEVLREATLRAAGVPGTEAPRPMQGLADWLREQARHPCATAENRATWTAWAREVDAACGVEGRKP